jgi:hypothetical protein
VAEEEGFEPSVLFWQAKPRVSVIAPPHETTAWLRNFSGREVCNEWLPFITTILALAVAEEGKNMHCFDGVGTSNEKKELLWLPHPSHFLKG